MTETNGAGPACPRNGQERENAPRLKRKTQALGLALMTMASAPALAQEVVCPAPAAEADSPAATGTSARDRLRHSDPLVRDMAQADLLYDEGRRDEAEAIYRRLAEARPDRRQTARRARLKLAQVAIRRGDLAQAENYVRQATGPGALPELRQRGRRVTEQIEQRRGVLAAEAALDAVDPLAAAGRFDEAIAATQALLQQPCPHPADYPSRVRLRLAQLHRAKGDFASARAVAEAAQAGATTERVRERAGVVIGEIETAAQLAATRATIEQANALVDAGNPAGAVELLQPLLAAQPPLPPADQVTARLRLARAYAALEQHDAAIAVVEPLLAPAPAPGAVPTLSAEQYDAVTRIYLARAAYLQEQGQAEEAELAYRQILAWNPAPAPEVQASARLGLARVLARQGKRRSAIEQIELARSESASPAVTERASRLLADVEGDTPLGRVTGYAQAGLAYDSNAPTRISALNDDDNADDVPFPTDRRFDDFHAALAARVEYRQAMNDEGSDYLDLAAYGQRTLQFDLPELDRTRVGVVAGPVLTLPGGSTRLRIGGQFDAQWRGDRFRSSEPGAYIGIAHEFTDRFSVAAQYTLSWHNDYQDERDGINHELETRARYDLTAQDVLTIDARVEREEGKVNRVENWRVLGGAALRHRWRTSEAVVPFVEIAGDAERVLYDGRELNGEKRRDWKLNAEAAGGADIGENWRVRGHYAFYDISSNQPGRDRLSDHQVGLTVRYSWR